MARTHGEGLAFPVQFNYPNIEDPDYHEGITRREYFAAHAPEPPMDLLLRAKAENPHVGLLAIIADFKFQYADAMIERSQR